MAGWKSSLASVLKEHNGIKASDGTVASHETQQKRATVLYQAFTDLRDGLSWAMSGSSKAAM